MITSTICRVADPKAAARTPDRARRGDVAANGFMAPFTAGLACFNRRSLWGWSEPGRRSLGSRRRPSACSLGPTTRDGAAQRGLRLHGWLVSFAGGLVLLALIGLAWYGHRAREINSAELPEDYRSVPDSLSQSRKATARSIVKAEIADKVGLIVGWAATSAVVGTVTFDILTAQHKEGLRAPLQWVAATGVSVGLLATTWLIRLTRQAFKDGALRRRLGFLWDVGTYWPRASQPFSPPCYAERSVPELTNRIRRALRDERDGTAPDDPDPAFPAGEAKRLEELRCSTLRFARFSQPRNASS